MLPVPEFPHGISLANCSLPRFPKTVKHPGSRASFRIVRGSAGFAAFLPGVSTVLFAAAVWPFYIGGCRPTGLYDPTTILLRRDLLRWLIKGPLGRDSKADDGPDWLSSCKGIHKPEGSRPGRSR